MSVPSPDARALLEAIDALHPVDLQSYLDAIEHVVVERLDAKALWQELIDRDHFCEIDLARLVIGWLTDSDENREFVLGKLAQLEVAP